MVKELHIGEVTNNMMGPDGNPFSRGEVMFKCETLLEDGSEYPIPAVPSFHYATDGYGIFFVPPPGTQIEVEVAQGRDKVVESRVRYRAMLYSDINEVPSEFMTNYPYRKGLKLPSGIIVFDDSPENEEWNIKVTRNLIIEVLSEFVLKSNDIKLGADDLVATAGVVTGQSLDPYTGFNHIDVSSKVRAEK